MALGAVQEVSIADKSISNLVEELGAEETKRFEHVLDAFQDSLAERTIWHINSTAQGGGVAEMLPGMLGYMRDFGIRARWLVVSGDDPFFRVTKRLHHALHGSSGDGSVLGDEARATYQRVCEHNAAGIEAFVQNGDVVIFHDPQTAGALQFVDADIVPIWRSHIGHDIHNEHVSAGWAFLKPWLEHFKYYVFSRREYVPRGFSDERVRIIPPSIDPLSVKNQSLSDEVVQSILTQIGFLRNEGKASEAVFERSDGKLGYVARRADILREGDAMQPADNFVLQVSRWDPLKDPSGVMRGFLHWCEHSKHSEGVSLVLLGPDVSSVTDDPEGQAVYNRVKSDWMQLPKTLRRRIQLITLPMDDVEENAAMVNAMQRQATVVIQKSIQEGFGLTVTEAMWKEKAVLASNVGGIPDQISDRETGVLLDKPHSASAFSDALDVLMESTEYRTDLGKRAKEFVRTNFLVTRHIQQYAELITVADGKPVELLEDPSLLASYSK